MTDEALADALAAADPGSLHVVCLPDFFLDHFVELPSWSEATAAMRRVHDQGGGNVQHVVQRLAAGGNAANTALALARLGVRAHLVARTSPFGAQVLRDTLGAAGVDLSHVRADGELAVTTALEFDDSPTRRNVMLSFAGSVASFGPESLNENARTLLEGSDAVLVSNWSQNSMGTPLVAEVSRIARRGGTLVALDTGDPSGRSPADVAALVEQVLELGLVDVFMVNENELARYSGENAATEPDALRAGAALAKRLGDRTRLDLHAARFATSFPTGARASAFDVHARRATGAGDAWNAGNLLGDLLGLAPVTRLRLANAVAACYVASQDGRPPTLGALRAFVSST